LLPAPAQGVVEQCFQNALTSLSGSTVAYQSEQKCQTAVQLLLWVDCMGLSIRTAIVLTPGDVCVFWGSSASLSSTHH